MLCVHSPGGSSFLAANVKLWRQTEILTPSIDAHLREEHFYKISSRSDLKLQSLSLHCEMTSWSLSWNYDIHVVTGTGFTDSSLSTLKRLHWLPIDARIRFKIATLTYKALHTGNPPYLASLLHRHNPCRALCSASANVLSVTRSNLSFGSRAFRAAAPTVWNSLPPHVRSCTTLTTFRKHLKAHLFQSSFPTA